MRQRDTVTMMTKTPTPWYKVPHVWLIIILPAVAVVASINFVILSFKTSDSLVRDDWYMDGKTVKQDIGRDVLAANLGLAGSMALSPTGQLNLSLNAASAKFAPAKELAVNLIHATEKSADVAAKVALVGDTSNQHMQYVGQLPENKPTNALKGKYYVELTDGKWRLRSEAVLPTSQLKFKPLAIYQENTAQ